jgi:hypothetical protein
MVKDLISLQLIMKIQVIIIILKQQELALLSNHPHELMIYEFYLFSNYLVFIGSVLN